MSRPNTLYWSNYLFFCKCIWFWLHSLTFSTANVQITLLDKISWIIIILSWEQFSEHCFVRRRDSLPIITDRWKFHIPSTQTSNDILKRSKHLSLIHHRVLHQTISTWYAFRIILSRQVCKRRRQRTHHISRTWCSNGSYETLTCNEI